MLHAGTPTACRGRLPTCLEDQAEARIGAAPSGLVPEHLLLDHTQSPPCSLPQANNTIAELEGLRRRAEQDEVAEEAAAKAASIARGQARKLR